MSSVAAAAERRWNCTVWPRRGNALTCNAPGARVGAEQLADQKIAAMKILQVFVHHQADEQITARRFLFGRRQLTERLRQHFVSRAVADFMNDVLLDPGQRPGLADRRAALGNHARQLHGAADGNRHAAVLEDVAVQINLRALLGEIAAGLPLARPPVTGSGA